MSENVRICNISVLSCFLKTHFPIAPYGHGWGSWNVSRSKGPLGDICEKDRFIFFLNLLELPVQSCKSESFIQ